MVGQERTVATIIIIIIKEVDVVGTLTALESSQSISNKLYRLTTITLRIRQVIQDNNNILQQVAQAVL